MSEYTLDNLRDWGRVIHEMDELRRLKLLGDHQDGLRRILRYKHNWRLREHALGCCCEIHSPSDALMWEVCSVLCDETAYVELRILAAKAIKELIKARIASGEDLPSLDGRGIVDKMNDIIERQDSPLLTKAVMQALDGIT